MNLLSGRGVAGSVRIASNAAMAAASRFGSLRITASRSRFAQAGGALLGVGFFDLLPATTCFLDPLAVSRR